MIEITCNDRLGKKVTCPVSPNIVPCSYHCEKFIQVRVKCNPDDTVGDLKKLIAAQTGTKAERIVLKKWYQIFKDHITLADYEIHDGANLEMYYQ